MHVWSEGATYRVVLHHGLAIGQVWRGVGGPAPRTLESATRLCGGIQRLLAQGIRPLGVIIDLAAAHAPALAESRSLLELLETLERIHLPVAVVARQLPGDGGGLAALVQRGAPSMSRTLGSVRDAEAWLQSRLYQPRNGVIVAEAGR